MKACFINPPIHDFYYTSIRRQPLGLLYIISSVESAGFRVSLVNGHSLKKHVMPLPGEFSYLKKYMDSRDPLLSFPFKRYCHFGMSYDEIRRGIALSGADVFFISSLFTPYYQETDEIIRMVRGTNRKAIVVLGGYHAVQYPEYYLQTGGADFVVLGEGEESSALLMCSLQTGADPSGVPNLAYRHDGRIIRTETRLIGDVDALPFPARNLLKQRDFKAYRTKAASMITSRGCPNRCGFCTSRVIWGPSHRMRSIRSIRAEIRECVECHGATLIIFEDDNIFPTRERASGLLEALVSCRKEMGMELDLAAMNGVSLEGLDEEIVSLMNRAGFRELNISLMSRSPELQKKQGRPFNSEKFARVAAAGRGSGMNVRAYFILGLPGQTLQEVRDTIGFLNGLDVKIFPSVYYNVRAPQGQWKMQRSSAFYNETDDLSRDDLVRLFNECGTLNTRS
jgi:radical SAM superfamily enzyme YgiQ (UPF0313 family)